MQPTSWLGLAVAVAAFLAAMVSRKLLLCSSSHTAIAKLTLRDVCGSEEACWAVKSSGAAVSSLATAFAGRHWIFNNESPPRGAYAEGLDIECVRPRSEGAVQNHTMGAAHECFVERCGAPLRACALVPACRGEWTKVVGDLLSVVDVATLRPEGIARPEARALASCFFSRCLCVADLAVGEPAKGEAAGGHVARFPDAIDDDDVRAILSLAASIGEDPSFVEDRNFGSLPRGQSSPLGGQRATYLQSRFTTDPLTARLYPRLRALVVRADAQSGWRRVHAATLVPRTIELLNYSSGAQHAGAALSLGWHTDEQSAVTALLLLSDPANFSGGELYHLAHGQMHAAHARQHELLVYRSHTPHAVGALTAGTRLAVALEFWHVHVPGEGVDHPAYPHRRVGLERPRTGGGRSAPPATLGRCPL